MKALKSKIAIALIFLISFCLTSCACLALVLRQQFTQFWIFSLWKLPRNNLQIWMRKRAIKLPFSNQFWNVFTSCLLWCVNNKQRFNIIGLQIFSSTYLSFCVHFHRGSFWIIDIFLTGFFHLPPVFNNYWSLFQSLFPVISALPILHSVVLKNNNIWLPNHQLQIT